MATTTNYIWDDDNIIAEADANDNINVVCTYEPEQHGHLISTRIGNTTSYHHYDATGSIRELKNAASNVTDRITYDAWGNVVSRTGTTPIAMLWIGELGYYYDVEMGQYSVRERPYDPENARWTTIDPSMFIDGLNRFIYVLNRPVVAVDPSGHALCLTCDKKPNSKCGAFSWPAKFGGLGKVKGVLLQLIVVKARVNDCDGNLIQRTTPCGAGGPTWGGLGQKFGTTKYWEVWYFDGTTVRIPGLNSKNELNLLPINQPLPSDDTFTGIGGDNTHGALSVTGTLYFVPGMGLDALNAFDEFAWVVNQAGMSKALPVACNSPEIEQLVKNFGGGKAETATRYVKTKWCCCKGPGVAQFDDQGQDADATPICAEQ